MTTEPQTPDPLSRQEFHSSLWVLLFPIVLGGCSTLWEPVPQNASAQRDTDPLPFFIGTYTDAGSEGIYRSAILESDLLASPNLAATSQNPSFLALDPAGRFLYSVNEIADFEGQATGAVSSFALLDGGALQPVNEQPSGGRGPCHLALDVEGRWVAVANYGGGSTTLLPVLEDGSLGPPSSVARHEGSSVNRARQSEPHAHCVGFSSDGSRLYSADLGTDEVLVYDIRDGGHLTEATPRALRLKPGAGPRHFALSADGRFLYVINELDSTVSVFGLSPGSGVEPFQVISTLPAGFAGDNWTAEIQLSADGRYLYGSNRGHDSLVVFATDPDSGKLTLVQHQSCGGQWPRSFSLDPTGRYLVAANQRSDNVVLFHVDPRSGRLTPAGSQIEVSKPVCILFAGRV